MTVGEYIEKLNKFDKNLEIRKRVYLDDEIFYFNVAEPKCTTLKLYDEITNIIEI